MEKKLLVKGKYFDHMGDQGDPHIRIKTVLIKENRVYVYSPVLPDQSIEISNRYIDLVKNFPEEYQQRSIECMRSDEDESAYFAFH